MVRIVVAAFLMTSVTASPLAALPLGGSAVITDESLLTLVQEKPRKPVRKRIGSSTPPSLTPIQPNAPVGPEVNRAGPSPSMPSQLAIPRDRAPYIGRTGQAYPVPSQSPNSTFQDRAIRCQQSATLSGVPNSQRGSYVHNCAM